MYTPTLLNNGEPGLDDDEIGPTCYGYGWDIMNHESVDYKQASGDYVLP